MYILILTILGSIIFYYWNTIINIFFYIKNLSESHFKIGNPWFASLLFTNILILIFVIYFYNYKNKVSGIGRKGQTGLPGKTGLEGEVDYIRNC